MKKMMTNIRTLAAVLIASVTFAACPSDDIALDEQPAQTRTYTMTVNATMARRLSIRSTAAVCKASQAQRACIS